MAHIHAGREGIPLFVRPQRYFSKLAWTFAKFKTCSVATVTSPPRQSTASAADPPLEAAAIYWRFDCNRFFSQLRRDDLIFVIAQEVLS
jgi:hypothetical protein